MSTMRLPDGTLVEIQQELIDCTPMMVPDLSWRFVDPNGHEHAWRDTTKPGEPSADLPTLRQVVDVEGGEWFDEDGFEEYTPPVTHYECLQCGAEVPDPAVKANSQQYFVGGLKRIYINGEPASQEQADELKRRWMPNEEQ